MSVRQKTVTLGLALLVTMATVAAKLAIDLDGSSWDFPSLVSKSAVGIKKLGKLKGQGLEVLGLELLPGGDFEAAIQGKTLTGTWSRKSEVSKKVTLTLDQEGEQTVADLYESAFEEAIASEGYDIDLALTLVKSKTRVAIKTKKKAGVAQAKLTLRFQLQGTATGEGVVQVPTKAKGRIKGDSFEVPLEDLLP